MNFHPTTSTYKNDRYTFILLVEETGNVHLTPYNDGKDNVTIGVGFNLEDDNVRNQVLEKMGITNVNLINKLAEYLGVKQEKGNAVIQSELDDIVNQYTPGATFKFTDENQIKELFNGSDGNNGLVQTYENRVDKWASDKGLVAIPESNERMVLVSLSKGNGVRSCKIALSSYNFSP